MLAVDPARTHLHDAEPSRRRERVAVDPVVAETVVVARDERFGADLSDQVIVRELLSGQGAERPVEGNDDHVIHPQLFQQGRFLVERRQQPQPFGLSQRDARVRLEGQHDAFAAVGAGLGDQPPDQGAVAQVHAVVRPDGDRRTDEVRKCVETVKYPHLSLPLRHTVTNCSRRSP